MKRLLVTGSSGLIGSEVCMYFGLQGWSIDGVDNNSRARFFGPGGDTRWNQQRLADAIPDFRHHEVDIRDRTNVLQLVDQVRPTAIVHAAAQPSHDLAARIPFDDFDTNAVGTLNVLEAARAAVPDAPFVFLSTNKVYGDRPNTLALDELDTRWEYAREADWHGIPESMSIDASTHSLFGTSKVAADVMVQEYGRYFDMPTVCLRGGCLTGPNHAGVELHGFLNYLVKCACDGTKYTVFGYKGKQVRDNIHSLDVARFIDRFIEHPRQGEIYNIGGGRGNSCSVVEAIALVERISGRSMAQEYVDAPRKGDHVCYISDLRKASSHYPGWEPTQSLTAILEETYTAWMKRLAQS